MQPCQRGSGARFHDTQRQAIGRARLARELQKSRPFCMPTLSHRAKSQALRAARFTGAFRSIRDSRWRGRRLLILGYHGVALEDEHEWDAALYISQPRLESQLRTLCRAGCTVLALDEALRALEDGRLPPRSVAITFDDGNHDFHERAFPVLQALELPATVYLTTYHCDHETPVFRPMCSYLLWKARDRTIALADLTGSHESFDLRTRDGRLRGGGPRRLSWPTASTTPAPTSSAWPSASLRRLASTSTA